MFFAYLTHPLTIQYNSYGSDVGPYHGSRNSGYQYGNTFGGSFAGAHGSIVNNGGLFYGEATGSATADSSGIILDSGASAIVTLATGNGVNREGVKAESGAAVVVIDNTNGSNPTLINNLVGDSFPFYIPLLSTNRRNPSYILERTIDDTRPITFSWPNSIDVVQCDVSINNGPYVPTVGTTEYLRPENGKYYYTLSYNVEDRPSEEGVARYRFYSDSYSYIATVQIIPQVSTEDIGNIINSKLSSSTINIISPLDYDGTSLNVIQGDDYLTIDGRNILFSGDIEDQWLDLTGSTVIIGVYGTSISKECVVISATGMQQISLELTSTDTDIPQGTYDYDVQATLSNGSIITLFRGKFTCSKSYTN